MGSMIFLVGFVTFIYGVIRDDLRILFGIMLMGVVRVVGGQDRRLDLLCDLQQLRVGGSLLRNALVLKLDEEVVAAEDFLKASCVLQRRLLLALHERLEDVAAETTRCCDDPLAVPVSYTHLTLPTKA